MSMFILICSILVPCLAYSPTASPIAADTSSASVFGAYYRPKDKDKEFEGLKQ